MAVGTAALELFGIVPGMPGELILYEGQLRISGCDCALQRLYVRQAARKHGVGSLLMQTAVDRARDAKKSAMEIWSDKRFTDAHRLYERVGAKVVGERICHDPDESPEWGLVLPLLP